MLEKMLENPYFTDTQTFNPSVGTGSVTMLQNTGKIYFLDYHSFLFLESILDLKQTTEEKKEVALSPARKLPLRFLFIFIFYNSI